MYISSRLLQASWGLRAGPAEYTAANGQTWGVVARKPNHDFSCKKNQLMFDKWRTEM
jgi:hypothetical protein